MKQFCVYVYQCPKTFELFYIGQDSLAGFRASDWYYGHLHGAVKNKIKKLERWGLEPIVYALFESDVCTKHQLDAAEVYWISEGFRLGWPLMNCTEGGGGLSGYSVTEETKGKISRANTGKKRTAEQVENIRRAHVGIVPSKETRAKMSRARKGKKFSEEHKKALKKSWHLHHNDDTAEKIAASKRGKPRTDDVRAKQSKALKGKPWSEARRRAQQNQGQEIDVPVALAAI